MDIESIVRRKTGFSSFSDLLNSSPSYRPSICLDDPELVALADAYDAAQGSRGDSRRAYRYGKPAKPVKPEPPLRKLVRSIPIELRRLNREARREYKFSRSRDIELRAFGGDGDVYSDFVATSKLTQDRVRRFIGRAYELYGNHFQFEVLLGVNGYAEAEDFFSKDHEFYDPLVCEYSILLSRAAVDEILADA